MSSQTILCDVDSVVADTHVTWLEMYNRDYGDSLTVDQITAWGIHLFVKPECGTHIYDYLHDPSLYEMTSEVAGAREGVARLREMGHEVVFLSAGYSRGKIEWLFEHGFMTPCFHWENSRDYIITARKDLIRGNIMIDDNPENLKGRLLPVVFDRPWNRKAEGNGLIRLSNWQEIVGWAEALFGGCKNG